MAHHQSEVAKALQYDRNLQIMLFVDVFNYVDETLSRYHYTLVPELELDGMSEQQRQRTMIAEDLDIHQVEHQ